MDRDLQCSLFHAQNWAFIIINQCISFYRKIQKIPGRHFPSKDAPVRTMYLRELLYDLTLFFSSFSHNSWVANRKSWARSILKTLTTMMMMWTDLPVMTTITTHWIGTTLWTLIERLAHPPLGSLLFQVGTSPSTKESPVSWNGAVWSQKVDTWPT